MGHRLAPAFPGVIPVANTEQARHLQLRGQFRLVHYRHFGFPFNPPLGGTGGGMIVDLVCQMELASDSEILEPGNISATRLQSSKPAHRQIERCGQQYCRQPYRSDTVETEVAALILAEQGHAHYIQHFEHV